MKIIKLVNRWFKMLIGKSSFHVKQDIGKLYSVNEIKGYYNDLTNKVSDATFLDENEIPLNTTIANVKAYFPISIFQYGLGLYDLYLLTNDRKYYSKFMKIVDWAVNNIDKNGMWDCMEKLNDTAHKTQSAMCQSEGVSLLLRAYVSTKNDEYFNLAKKAIEFMIKPICDGGTAIYNGDNIYFQEYVSDYNLTVLNGWIFSIFGLYDFTLVCSEKKYKNILDNTVETLSKTLKKYDRGFWSDYDLKGTIASPAYHDLHIRQLKLLYDLFHINEFNVYANKWSKYQKSKLKMMCAMAIKFRQKIFKSKYYDINTSLVR